MEEVQRKHDLLVDIVRKEQSHNRRLVSIKAHKDLDPSHLPTVAMGVNLALSLFWLRCITVALSDQVFPFQRDFKERVQQQKATQSRLREQRQQVARAKKYHSDYHVQHRARLMRARTKEEKVGGDATRIKINCISTSAKREVQQI